MLDAIPADAYWFPSGTGWVMQLAIALHSEDDALIFALKVPVEELILTCKAMICGRILATTGLVATAFMVGKPKTNEVFSTENDPAVTAFSTAGESLGLDDDAACKRLK